MYQAKRLNKQLGSISGIGDLRLLCELKLDNNDIRDISPVLELPFLEYLSIRGNPIENIEVLDEMGSR